MIMDEIWTETIDYGYSTQCLSALQGALWSWCATTGLQRRPNLWNVYKFLCSNTWHCRCHCKIARFSPNRQHCIGWYCLQGNICFSHRVHIALNQVHLSQDGLINNCHQVEFKSRPSQNAWIENCHQVKINLPWFSPIAPVLAFSSQPLSLALSSTSS